MPFSLFLSIWSEYNNHGVCVYECAFIICISLAHPSLIFTSFLFFDNALFSSFFLQPKVLEFFAAHMCSLTNQPINHVCMCGSESKYTRMYASLSIFWISYWLHQTLVRCQSSVCINSTFRRLICNQRWVLW